MTLGYGDPTSTLSERDRGRGSIRSAVIPPGPTDPTAPSRSSPHEPPRSNSSGLVPTPLSKRVENEYCVPETLRSRGNGAFAVAEALVITAVAAGSKPSSITIIEYPCPSTGSPLWLSLRVAALSRRWLWGSLWLAWVLANREFGQKKSGPRRLRCRWCCRDGAGLLSAGPAGAKQSLGSSTSGYSASLLVSRGRQR